MDPDCDPHTVVVVMVGLGLHRARFEVLPRGFCMRILLTYNASATASLLFTGGGGVLTAHMPTTNGYWLALLWLTSVCPLWCVLVIL